jgi:hypothetical protein
MALSVVICLISHRYIKMATLSSAPMSVQSNGMVVASGLPAEVSTPAANISGGLLNAAAAKTADSIKAQAAHAKEAGAGQKGGRKKFRGGNLTIPPAAEGKTIPGVSFGANFKSLVETANQLKADAVYDNQAGAQPYKLGGFRRVKSVRNHHRRFERIGTQIGEAPVVTAGRKHTRKTKKNVRRRRNRNSRRRSRVSSRNTRRNRNVHRKK